MLVDLLRPAGADLARRWLAILLLVDEAERPALVAETERRIARRTSDRERDPAFDIVHPPVQRDGYVEQTHVTYAADPSRPVAKAPAKQSSKAAAKPPKTRRSPAADSPPASRRVCSRK
jgi:hypothetical protein